MNRPTPPWRKVVVEELQLIASEPEQREYQRKVPHIDVTAELASGWFDDAYHPSDPQFTSCFSEAELAALARFNQCYTEVLPLLPKRAGTVESWLATESWRTVMREASATLASVAA